jgi:hypothetical protein
MGRLCCINLDGHVIYSYDISGVLGLAKCDLSIAFMSSKYQNPSSTKYKNLSFTKYKNPSLTKYKNLSFTTIN